MTPPSHADFPRMMPMALAIRNMTREELEAQFPSPTNAEDVTPAFHEAEPQPFPAEWL